jgi:hypothetical protein
MIIHEDDEYELCVKATNDGCMIYLKYKNPVDKCFDGRVYVEVGMGRYYVANVFVDRPSWFERNILDKTFESKILDGIFTVWGMRLLDKFNLKTIHEYSNKNWRSDELKKCMLNQAEIEHIFGEFKDVY